MSTVGYGDQFPVTLGGRITLALSAFSGGIVLSMTFVAIGSYLNLSSDESLVLDEVDKSFTAAEAIYCGYKFSTLEKKSTSDFLKLREKINAFKTVRLQGGEVTAGVTPEILDTRIHELNAKLAELNVSVTSLAAKFNKLKD